MFFLFTQGEQVTNREQRLSQHQRFTPGAGEVLVSCFRKCFQAQRWGKSFQQHSKVQEFRVLRTPGGWLGRYKELMSLQIQAGRTLLWPWLLQGGTRALRHFWSRGQSSGGRWTLTLLFLWFGVMLWATGKLQVRWKGFPPLCP